MKTIHTITKTIDINTFNCLFLFILIDKRWLLKPLPYETCCSLLLFHIQFVSLFYLNWPREQDLFIFGQRIKRGKFAKERGTNHP